MSFIYELKRRNVFRVAAAYAVSSWLILQVIDVVGPILAVPDSVARVTLILLLIGFPVSLILAWVFEFTPQGIVLDRDVDVTETGSAGGRRKFDIAIILGLTAALTLLALDRFLRIEPEPEGAVEVDHSIAVLPFRSISASADDTYFAEGLAEEVIDLLATIPELRVIGRTSSFAFKDQVVDAKGIGEVLNVSSVLEGSVRLAGDRLRISVRLLDTSSAAQLWAENYDRVLSDVFAVQEEVAASIIDALNVQFGAAPSRGRPTENQQAYGLFLKAKHELNSFLFKEALNTLNEVLALDPNFAQAYEIKAYVLWFLSATAIDAAEGQKLAGEAAARALAIDPTLPIARAMDVSANTQPYSFLAETEALETALTVQIDNPWLLDMLMFRLVQTGYLEQAVEVGERFVAADPLSAVAHNRMSEAYYAVGRVEEAFAAAMIVNDLDQNSDTAFWNLAHMSLAQRRDEDAIRFFELFLRQFDLDDTSWVRDLITAARAPGAGTAVLDQRIPEIVAALPDEYAFEIGAILESWYLYFDDLDRFFTQLNASDVSGETWTNAEVPLWQGTIFRHLGFTGDPRYVDIARRIGFTEMWDQRGAPDFCRKTGRRWVCD